MLLHIHVHLPRSTTIITDNYNPSRAAFDNHLSAAAVLRPPLNYPGRALTALRTLADPTTAWCGMARPSGFPPDWSDNARLVAYATRLFEGLWLLAPFEMFRAKGSMYVLRSGAVQHRKCSICAYRDPGACRRLLSDVMIDDCAPGWVLSVSLVIPATEPTGARRRCRVCRRSGAACHAHDAHQTAWATRQPLSALI